MSGISCSRVSGAGRRPCPWRLFHASTGLDTYPEALQPSVRAGVLQYACNSEIGYRLRGVRVRQTAEWRQREPEGAGDLHRLTIRGSRCHVVVRQDEQTEYKPMLHLVPAAGVALSPCCLRSSRSGRSLSPGLQANLPAWGVFAAPTSAWLGHERHFALVLNTLLEHLDRGTWPQALPARIRLRYTLLAQAQDLGSGSKGASA